MNRERINTVFIDFDGTLCCERYFLPLGGRALETISELLFGSNSPEWADRWMKGDLRSRDIADYLSEHLPETSKVILSALRRGCANMNFNGALLDFAAQQRDSGRRTALVTANMDVFTEVVVPAHDLDRVFDMVLSTSDHGTLDKSVLWRKTLASFGPEHTFGTSLLIEVSPKAVSLFRALGGYAHQYVGDPGFQAWLGEHNQENG